MKPHVATILKCLRKGDGLPRPKRANRRNHVENAVGARVGSHMMRAEARFAIVRWRREGARNGRAVELADIDQNKPNFARVTAVCASARPGNCVRATGYATATAGRKRAALLIMMQKSLLSGALLVAVLLPSARVARAQEDTPNSLNINRILTLDGNALLEKAGTLITDGPQGTPATTETLTPEENLARQKLAVSRSPLAFSVLEFALNKGINEAPVVENDDDEVDDDDTSLESVPQFVVARKLGDLLAQRADVRAASGNFGGAADDDILMMKLGAQIGHGKLLNTFAGEIIIVIAHKALRRHASGLDATQSRKVAAQLDELTAQAPSYIQLVRAEDAANLARLRGVLADMGDAEMRAQALSLLDKTDMDERIKAMTVGMLKNSPAQVEADYRARYNLLLARAALPYIFDKRAAMSAPADNYLDLLVLSLTVVDSRFYIEANVVAKRMLAAGLRLRALKIETGAYPAQFDAGADPFSPTLAPLVYKKSGDSYVLYSVGPDGTDDNGAEIQTLETNDDTGFRSVSDNVAPNSIGDIVATVF